MNLGSWWGVLTAVLVLLFVYGAGAAGPLEKKGGLRLVVAAAILAVLLTILFINSPDAPHINDWIFEQIYKMLGE
jgi:multisubunit Na+/H+ antiporter MnhB subunit